MPRRALKLTMERRSWRSGMLPALLVALIAMAVTNAAQESGPPRLFDLITAHGIVDERPFHPAAVFAPDQEVIYLWYAADGCAIGTTIRSLWIYLEKDPPVRLADGSVVVEQAGTWGQFNFRLAPGKRWAIGRYRVELWVGDELVASTYFEVSPRTTVRLDTGADRFTSPAGAPGWSPERPRVALA